MVTKSCLENENVCVIDCDPQMNTTYSLLVKNNIDFEPYYNLFFFKTQTFVDKNEIKEISDLYNLLQCGARLDLGIEWDQKFKPHKIKIFDKEITLVSSHPMMMEYEQNLALEFNQNFRTYTNTIKIGRFFQWLKDKKYTRVFVDLSPSSSFFNQHIIAQTQYLILPCSADLYSNYAVKTVSLWLKTWAEKYKVQNIWKNPGIKCVVYNRYKVGTKEIIGIKTTNGHCRHIKKLQESLKDIGNPPLIMIRDILSIMAKMQDTNSTVFDFIAKGYEGEVLDNIKIEILKLWNIIEDIELNEVIDPTQSRNMISESENENEGNEMSDS